jgi:hypothetical protein
MVVKAASATPAARRPAKRETAVGQWRRRAIIVLAA